MFTAIWSLELTIWCFSFVVFNVVLGMLWFKEFTFGHVVHQSNDKMLWYLQLHTILYTFLSELMETCEFYNED